MKLTIKEVHTLLGAIEDAWEWNDNRMKFIGEEDEEYADIDKYQQDLEIIEKKLREFSNSKESKDESEM